MTTVQRTVADASAAPGTGRSERSRLDPQGLRRAAERILLGLVPLLALVGLLVFVFGRNDYAVDFHFTYWPAGERLLHGSSPYVATQAQLSGGWTFVYPALAALLFAPFALISHGTADVVYMVLCILCVPSALVVLNVRDWRIYGAVMMWLPVFGAWQSSNLTSPLLLALALVWRYRDRPAVAGGISALAISLKPFVWPIMLWLLVTRRWRAAAWGIGVGLAVNLVAWSVVGFGAIGRYLHLSSAVTSALWRDGYGVLAVAGRLGLSQTAGTSIEILLALVLIGAIAWLGWRHHAEQALVLTVALMLIASPLIWTHYFALLLIPLAILRPRLSPVWFAPLLVWVCPERTGVHPWQILLVWMVAALCLYWPYRSAA